MRFKKKTIIIIITVVAIAILVAGSAVAEGNISELEQKWYDFQEAFIQKQIDNGKISQEDADAQLEEIMTDIKSDGNDIIKFDTKRIREKIKERLSNRNEDQTAQEKQDRAKIDIEEIFGITAKELFEKMREEDKSLWEVAQEMDKTQELTDAVTEFSKKIFDRIVELGKMTQEEADEKIAEIIQELESGKGSMFGGLIGGLDNDFFNKDGEFNFPRMPKMPKGKFGKGIFSDGETQGT